MRALAFGAGLTPHFTTPPPGTAGPEDVITEEAGLRAPWGQRPRVTLLVKREDVVAQGAPIAGLRDEPHIRFVAPMPARVAHINLLPGRKLSEIVLFHEAGGDRQRFDTAEAETGAGLRRLMQDAGAWTWLRRRPFGGMPAGDEQPAAIVVMAVDTRPLAPDPRRALDGREEDFARGLAALARLTDGPLLVCQRPGPALFDKGLGEGRVKAIDCGPRHPQGAAGIRVHDLFPAEIDAPVWDIEAEDVAALGALIETGHLPMLRQVHVAGAALREARLLRTQPGADLRELTQRYVAPGPHVLMSGSPLDGHAAHWLAPGHRQVTVLPRAEAAPTPHWLVAALTRSAQPKPIIPTAALTQALGAAVPAGPFVRALSAGDDEMAMRLGVLSLLEDDLALADYVLGGEAHLRELLRGMLDRIRKELAA